MGFLHDLKAGEGVEQEILDVIKKKFPHAYKETGKFCREFFDIIIPKKNKQREIKIEIKNDKYKSENVCFEFLGRHAKNSGITRTTAHVWIHFRNGRYLIWYTEKLKIYLLCEAEKKYIKSGGDDKATKMYVIPEEIMLKECPPDVILEKGNDKLNDFLSERVK